MSDSQCGRRRRHYTRKTGLDLIHETFGIRVPESRFDKDAMVDADPPRLTPAPRPVATYGRTHLYTEEQILRYGESLIAELALDPKDAAA
jgi:hypothetical protein